MNLISIKTNFNNSVILITIIPMILLIKVYYYEANTWSE